MFLIERFLTKPIYWFYPKTPPFMGIEILRRDVFRMYQEMDDLYLLKSEEKLLDTSFNSKRSSQVYTLREVDFVRYTGSEEDRKRNPFGERPFFRVEEGSEYFVVEGIIEEEFGQATLYNPIKDKTYVLQGKKGRHDLFCSLLLYHAEKSFLKQKEKLLQFKENLKDKSVKELFAFSTEDKPEVISKKLTEGQVKDLKNFQKILEKVNKVEEGPQLSDYWKLPNKIHIDGNKINVGQIEDYTKYNSLSYDFERERFIEGKYLINQINGNREELEIVRFDLDGTNEYIRIHVRAKNQERKASLLINLEIIDLKSQETEVKRIFEVDFKDYWFKTFNLKHSKTDEGLSILPEDTLGKEFIYTLILFEGKNYQTKSIKR